ncbi:MAG: hypothetical protein ACRCYU_08485 [Nocardioides sp.]
MNRAEHYKQAEHLLAEVDSVVYKFARNPGVGREDLVAVAMNHLTQAQVHATLATVDPEVSS